MDSKKKETTIKALLYWLKHHPTHIGLTLEKDGWTDVDILSNNSKKHHKVTVEEINFIVENDEKKRFSLSKDGKKIKANEGHTVKIS